MPGSAVHGRLRVWSVSGLSIAVAVAWGPTAALADTGALPEQESQATEQVADSAGTASSRGGASRSISSPPVDTRSSGGDGRHA